MISMKSNEAAGTVEITSTLTRETIKVDMARADAEGCEYIAELVREMSRKTENDMVINRCVLGEFLPDNFKFNCNGEVKK